MKYKFISAHKIIGVTRPAEGEERVIATYPETRSEAILTYDLDDHLFDIDRARAVGLMMLKGLVGQGAEDSFDDRLERELAEIRETRKKDIGSGVFLVYKSEGEVDSWNPRNSREFEGFTLAFEGTPKGPIRQLHQAPINGVLASFALGSDNVCGVKKIADGVYFIADAGKPAYSMDFEMSGSATVSMGLKPAVVEYVQKYAKVLGGHPELVDPARLLSRSLSDESDRLLSLLSIWSGLEIFVSKVFKSYEAAMFPEDEKKTSNAVPEPVVKRIREVMKDKYRIADKFSVVSSLLAPDEAEEDVAKFKIIKDVRDKLMHGGEVELKTLPIQDTQLLLRKYLRLHAERIVA